MKDKDYQQILGIRDGFFIGDKYRLDLSWDTTSYPEKGICCLENAKFSGPALQFAERIEGNNHMMLDFCKQYFIFTQNMYVGQLSWGKVEYLSDGNVKLHNCTLTYNNELNKVPNLNNTDKLVIDTTGHDAEVHAFNPVYNTYVADSSWKVYNYIDKR